MDWLFQYLIFFLVFLPELRGGKAKCHTPQNEFQPRFQVLFMCTHEKLESELSEVQRDVVMTSQYGKSNGLCDGPDLQYGPRHHFFKVRIRTAFFSPTNASKGHLLFCSNSLHA